jgi:hypothetical protein
MSVAANAGQAPRNAVDVRSEFSFKGEEYCLVATLDLDWMLERRIDPDSLHQWLAQEHGIDTYSYLFEVMEVDPVVFENPRGLAIRFHDTDGFDFEGYAQAHQLERVLNALQHIAAREMAIDDLTQHPRLQQALLQAYQLGIKA